MPTRKTPRKKPASARTTTRRIQRTSRTAVKVQTRKEATTIPTVALPTSTWSTIVIVLAAAILAFGLFLVFRTPAVAPTTTEQNQNITYQGVEGKTALELLKTKADVETQNFDGIGELVSSINGIASTSDRFWIYYVNGEQGQVGAGAYVTKSTDTIEWRYEQAQ